MSDEGERGDTTVCEACGTAVPTYDVVRYGSIERGYQELCNRCFNAAVAGALGLERFEHVRLQPAVMTDCAGEKHEFHFRIRLLGNVMALDAFELKAGVPGGYQFQILGEPDDEPLPLLGRLIERIRRSLSIRYLVRQCGFRRSRPGIPSVFRAPFQSDAAHQSNLMPPRVVSSRRPVPVMS